MRIGEQCGAIERNLPIAAQLIESGFVRLLSPQTFRFLGAYFEADWASFAASWNNLPLDCYMADGGRYRRRRYAAFAQSAGRFIRKPHQPHYQSRDHNTLNGGIERWFEPVLDATSEHAVTKAIFAFCASAIAAAEPMAKAWQIEFHQFRIETTPGKVGRPTPEGLHRDGADWVFVLLVNRSNVREGTTEICDADGRRLGRFQLAQAGDAILFDDRRVLHGVTEIHPVDPTAPAFRDVLVVTFIKSDR